MAYISTPNGMSYFINNLDDMANMIYEQLGEEIYRLFCQYATQCTREYVKAHSDLDSYESSLESNARAFSDILDVIKAMDTHLAEAPRMNRQELRQCCDRIDTIISNQI